MQSGHVDCIIVKDLSRFGRDYIEAGRLIQKTFPAFHVRFIAVTDHFDSLTADDNQSSWMLPVKNFVNDSYCRDISAKVKSHQRIKREKGEFIGAFPPYGYVREEGCRNKLVPDAYAAEIVREIFAWKLEGMSSHGIAERLNQAGVLSPMEYKKIRGENYSTGFAVRFKAEWSAVAVKRILTNEIYTGTMVQGKSEKINYKLAECRPRPKEQWIRVQGTHAPIVGREDFDRVQKLLAVPARAVKGEKKAHMFSGILFCGDCGRPMMRRVNRSQGMEKICFICSSSNQGQGCSRHHTPIEELKAAVLEALRLQTLLFWGNRELCFHGYTKEDSIRLAERQQEILRLYRKKERYLVLREALCEDVRQGIITQDNFNTFWGIYEKQYIQMQEAIRRQEEGNKRLTLRGTVPEAWYKDFKNNPRFEKLERELLLAFTDRILVYEDKRICLELRYREG